MKILLAPAETKLEGGEQALLCNTNFSFEPLYKNRLEVINHYEEFLSTNNKDELSKWFGLKNIKEVEKYSQSILTKPTMKAIQRYTGVAFDALDYNSMDENIQNYIDENVILFSNLFGAIKGSDLIPNYKYKQGAKLPNIDIEKYYKKHLKEILDDYLGDEVIDIRAGYYDKYYKPVASTITYKFLKDGKVVSHWAKYYRGKLLQVIAQNNIQNFTELMNLEIPNLKLLEIQEKKNIKTLIMEITN
jgi:cytoplasmic iron level regulating protein YaaA (DUF328/UPF0246 family)